MHAAPAQLSQDHRKRLLRKYRSRIASYPKLNRQLVSFQANKSAPIYNWFPYKEGFSAQMVSHLMAQIPLEKGTVLDPFAGAGTALFAAGELGWDAVGIELLPVGQFVFEARTLAQQVKPSRLRKEIDRTRNKRCEEFYDDEFSFQHVQITEKAFPKRNEKALAGYLAYCQREIKDPIVRRLMHFACLCVLEGISYTRKDGQYLRWDHRSGKPRSSKFEKSTIAKFATAIDEKLESIYKDILANRQQATELFPAVQHNSILDFRVGSCLEILPTMPSDSIDLVMTSPPYCNRYDYTRTYALELVFLGASDSDIKNLRQSLLSCTVENHEKTVWFERLYAKIGCEESLQTVTSVFSRQKALHEVLQILNEYRARNQLNNANIPKMVRNYFYEMCFVIYELARILRPGGRIVMVNDNVRYAGEEVPVDLILSQMADNFGLQVKKIWTLARGKGNSSQQMGNHGRTELRKCVYIWEK